MSSFYDSLPGRIGKIGGGEFVSVGYSLEQHVHELKREEFSRKKFAWVLASDLFENMTLATAEHIGNLCRFKNDFFPTGEYHLIIIDDVGDNSNYQRQREAFHRWVQSACWTQSYQFETARYGQSWDDLMKYKAEPPDWKELFLKKNFAAKDVLINLPLPNDPDRLPTHKVKTGGN